MAKLREVFKAGGTLAQRTIRIQILENALGYAWTLITPAIYAICYIFVKRELAGESGANGEDESWEIIRAFGGISLIQAWMQVAQEMAGMVRKHKGMLRGLEIGTAAFVFGVIIEGAVGFLIRIILILIAVLLLGLSLPQDLALWGWILLSVTCIHLSACAIGLLLAPWASLYGDFRKGLGSLNLPLILISPVFYEAIQKTDSFLYWINAINPVGSQLAVLSESLQNYPTSIYYLPLVGWFIFGAVLLYSAHILLRKQLPIILEKMGD